MPKLSRVSLPPKRMNCLGHGQHAVAVRAAIDQVAEQDHGRFRVRPLAMVGLDRFDQFLEQVTAAVDIADGVDALPRRHVRDRHRLLGPEQVAQRRNHRMVGYRF